MRKSEKVMIAKAEAVIRILRNNPKAKLKAQKEIDQAVNELEEAIKRLKGEA